MLIIIDKKKVVYKNKGVLIVLYTTV